MKLTRKVLIGGMMSLLMVSCADESPWTSGAGGTGKISLNVESSSEVSSEMPNVRSVSTDIVLPDVSLFKIRMTNEAGNYVKTWESVSEFERETQFKADNYTIEAYYGSEDSQGIVADDEAGYEHSYFYGKENIKVESDKETHVEIRPTLGNAVVVIEYSDAFKNYFTDWDTQLITKGKTSLKLGNSEGMAYVIPGDVDVVIDATQQNGKSVKVNPALFEAEAQHLYKITYNIYNGEIGKTDKLQVIFNDQPDAEHTIEIDLSDELLSGDGPVITTEGFETESSIDILKGSPYQGVVKFNVDSPAGYSEAVLTITNFNGNFLTDGTIDLLKADAGQQSALAEAGIKVLGLYNDPQRLALVDLTNFIPNLSEGEHEISLRVKDRSRFADASVKIVSYPISVNAQAKGPTVFGRRYADLILAYNGADPTQSNNNPFTFKVQGDSGLQDAPIRQISRAESTRAFETEDYIFRISVPEVNAEEIPVEVYFNNGTSPVANLTLQVDYPDYKVVYDPMARKLMLMVTGVNDSEVDFSQQDIHDVFNNRLRVFIDDKESNNLSISNNVITASGLPGGSNFMAKTSLRPANISPDIFENEQSLVYEAEAGVPNGNFSATTQTINEKINVGGEYTITVWPFTRDYQNTSSIVINEAQNWGSLNELTCYKNSSNKNSWYMVPGTYVNGNVYTIRTVGYHNQGKAIPTSDNGTSTIYYCRNIPQEGDLIKRAGELFLGSYTFDGATEHKPEGVSFSSRPSRLSFNYSYMARGDEKAYVSIKIKDQDGNVISSSEALLNTTNGWNVDESQLPAPSQTFPLDLPGYAFNRKAASLEILFKSTSSENPQIYIPEGNELKEPTVTTGNFTTDRGRTINPNEYHSLAKGSVLKISDITLTY